MIAIDTNILVYAFDTAYHEKRLTCQSLVKGIFGGLRIGVITNQILAEFVSVVTKKIEKPISTDQARAIIESILISENWKVINYNGEIIIKTLEHGKFNWDILIAETLKSNGIKEIITEDIKGFKELGLEPLNPFDFSLQKL